MKSSGLVGCREGSDEEENQGMWDPPLTENDKKNKPSQKINRITSGLILKISNKNSVQIYNKNKLLS